jgi:hypothetical protein
MKRPARVAGQRDYRRLDEEHDHGRPALPAAAVDPRIRLRRRPGGLRIFEARAAGTLYPLARPHICFDKDTIRFNRACVAEDVPVKPHPYVRSTIWPVDATGPLCHTCRGSHPESATEGRNATESRSSRTSTVLIDMASHRPVDMFDGRDGDSLADWLRQHPEVKVICRTEPAVTQPEIPRQCWSAVREVIGVGGGG